MMLLKSLTLPLLLLKTLHSVAQDLIQDSDYTFQEAVAERFESFALKLDTLRTFRIDKMKVDVATGYSRINGEEAHLHTYIYQAIQSGRYKQIFVDSQGVEGGLAELVTIFSANADLDTSNEIIALYQWHIRHYQLEGYIYEVKCYKRPLMGSSHLIALENQPPMDCGFEGYRNGKIEHAKYNTEAKIRRRLKQLGY